jgi:hypothetical protein
LVNDKNLFISTITLIVIQRKYTNQGGFLMSDLKKRKTYFEKCPVCGGEDHPLSDETLFFDELQPNMPVLVEVSPGRWAKVIERKPAKT